MELYNAIADSAVSHLQAVEERKARWVIQNEWLQAFCQGVKSVKGVWVFNGYKWHAFSFNLSKSLEGEPAVQAYKASEPAGAFAFDEDLEEMYSLEPHDQYPDLSALANDVYICDHAMTWTMAFTHEQPSIGPFYARRDWQ
ncbi:MAG: DUF4275 family protein [Planctomycetota bacterium]